jgi:hypothetical protein
MMYEVIPRKNLDKYIARVRDWPEVVIEEETREAAIAQIKQQLRRILPVCGKTSNVAQARRLSASLRLL